MLFYGSNNTDSVSFWNATFGEIKDHSLRTTSFPKKKTCYGSFAFMPTLRKKVFSRARVKCFSLYGSNKSYSFVFGNAASGEIKDNSLRMTPSPRTFFRRKFWVCVYISFCCFCEYRFCRDQRSQFLQYRFSKYF